MKKILLVLLSMSLLFANSAFAGRFGSGRSYGMQRNFAPKQSYSRQNSYSGTATQTPQQPGMTGQRSGMSPVAAGALGAAAGAAGGYMLGRSMSNNNNNVTASGVQAATTANAPTRESQIPWGAIILLVGILALGLIFFRKKINPSFNSQMEQNNFVNPNNARPSVGQRFSNIMSNGQNQQATQSNLDKMPDGIETIYFLRQAKGMFLHIQSMNNSENIEEIRKYMVSELFDSVKNDVANNSSIADFPVLDCQLIECLPLSAKDSDTLDTNQLTKPWNMEEPLVASVKFSGTVSDDPTQKPEPFGEIWNFIKSSATNGKWLVAGIQQETPTQPA